MILLVLPEMGSDPAVKAGCPCEGILETKSSRGVCSIALTETDREYPAKYYCRSRNIDQQHISCSIRFVVDAYHVL